MSPSALEESVVAVLRALSPEKQQEVLEFASFLAAREKRPLKSLHGILAGQGISISEEDIAEARKEMWANFPREF
ncbi:MAG: hypothetical protein ACKV22_14940 [Bryobacteraceae bacterium]